MKCIKCGHIVNELDDICENCGAPLNISTNQKDEKHSKKGKHIDIEEVTREQTEISFNETKKSVRKVLLFILLLSIIGIVVIIGFLLIEFFSHEVFEEYEDIMEHSPFALIYLGYDEKIDEKCIEYAENYGYDYLNIDVRSISYVKKKKIREELNVYNLTSTLVVVQDGVPVYYYSKISSEEELLEHLQSDNLIPSVIEDTTKHIENYEKYVVAQNPTIIYLPTSYSENTEDKSAAIKKISEENGLEYIEVKGYVLSQRQLLKIMSEIGFTVVQQDLILYVRDGNIVNILEATATSESDYFHLFSNRGIIDITSGDYLIEINNIQFSNMLKEKSKNVILIETSNCSYCERVRPILGKIASKNSTTLYYIDATLNKEQISNLIKGIGYEDGLTVTPYVLIVENNKYVDSIIGLASEDLYTNKFLEYGVIK